MKTHLLALALVALFSAGPGVQAKQPASQSAKKNDGKEYDNAGRQILRGPQPAGYYNNVHIISNSVGVEGTNLTVSDSVIEAPVCIKTQGMGVTVTGSTLNCGVCVEYTGGFISGNIFMNNNCTGIPERKGMF